MATIEHHDDAPARGASWNDDPLQYLIGPTDASDFFERIYEREALVVARNDPHRYEELLSIREIDDIISSTELHIDQIQITQADKRLSPADYSYESGMVDRGAIARRYQMGATIILPQLHTRHARLGQLCRRLEHDLSAQIQTNIYLTPPNSQGFRTHYDNHDVFVVQVEGEKLWRIYNKPVDTPYRGEGFEPGQFEVGELQNEFVLKAGECAYVPRGLMHDASTSGDHPSLHVTVGVIVRTWADLMLEAVSEVAVKNPLFRRSLPPGFARPDFDRSIAEAGFAERLEALGKEASLDGAFELFVDSFIRTRSIDMSGAVTAPAFSISAEDRFRARPYSQRRLAEDDGKPVIVAPGGEVNFEAGEDAALERALSGEAFTRTDLPGVSDEAALELMQKLYAFGLIERA